MLEWLSDDDNRELADEIEAVNSRMLERLLDDSPFLAVYFCKFRPALFLPDVSYFYSFLINSLIVPLVHHQVVQMMDFVCLSFSFILSFSWNLDDNDCPDCAAVLAELENIDDEADKFG